MSDPASIVARAQMRPPFQRPFRELVNARYSCRAYQDRPVATDVRGDLAAFLGSQVQGPFGSSTRFALVASLPGDAETLKGLGTYGFIKGATGFVVGALEAAEHDLEDYGYLLEEAILFATGLGLGTCWLGGTFTKGSFAKRLGGVAKGESMPAVVSLGYPGEDGSQRIREREGGDRRLAAASLFFEERVGRPMAPSEVGGLGPALEAVRMAPSASNKQPWRIVHDGHDWHFYLARTKGYGKGSLLFSALRLADLQRLDMGIAMCHFELVARDSGLTGTWRADEPEAEAPGLEYTATFRVSPAGTSRQKEAP